MSIEERQIPIPDVGASSKGLVEQLERFYETKFKALSEELAQVRAQVAEREKMLQDRENVIKSFEQEKADREAALERERAARKKQEIDATIEELRSTGAIPAKNAELEQHYRKMAEMDFETFKSIASNLPKQNAPTQNTPSAQQTNGAPSFTREQIAKMSGDEFMRFEKQILEQAAQGLLN